MQAFFYIDESGNTGSNWLDFSQPYFVYGGWLIREDMKNGVEDYLKTLLENTQAAELKSKNFFKKKDASTHFYDLFKKLVFEFYSIPYFVVVDKKFMVAAKIVETFFDCEYNPAVNKNLTHPIELKKALASCIVESEEVLKDFAVLINSSALSIESMGLINQKLIDLFISLGHTEVACSLKDLGEQNFEEMIDEFQVVTRQGTKMSFITLTGTMLVELLKNVELTFTNSNITVKVMHDRLRGYDEVFSELSTIFLTSKTPTVLGTDGRYFVSDFPHIKMIDMIDSKSEILIQASDLLCGFISKTFQTTQRNEYLDDHSREILTDLIYMHDEYVEDRVKLWNMYASYAFEERFILAMNNSNTKKTDYHSIIEKEFRKTLRNTGIGL
ncbi:DUF3800 domain-containing protein [Paenibacillus woosongensis]|uniref:DUF3800 domain-containing protein n=1 Tax=Paenibacillus woosongensis TaxID=307580 RepID=A0A7X2Z375_9BACL|nr:DUF3800 domain-containing protein [Paenibacillus woosongensis]MUG46734.1 DUF3800 domain-containing protein [Paenibacillus woosongensis]